MFIDWDGASAQHTPVGPRVFSIRLTLNDPAETVSVSAERLRAFVDGYGADAALRGALSDAVAQRTAAMRDMLVDAHERGEEPWASMHVSGHGAHWSAVADHVRRHKATWARALS